MKSTNILNPVALYVQYLLLVVPVTQHFNTYLYICYNNHKKLPLFPYTSLTVSLGNRDVVYSLWGKDRICKYYLDECRTAKG